MRECYVLGFVGWLKTKKHRNKRTKGLTERKREEEETAVKNYITEAVCD
jgi:hypothetical protein